MFYSPVSAQGGDGVPDNFKPVFDLAPKLILIFSVALIPVSVIYQVAKG